MNLPVTALLNNRLESNADGDA